MGDDMRRICRKILKERQLNDLNVQKKRHKQHELGKKHTRTDLIKSFLDIQKQSTDVRLKSLPHETAIDRILQKMQGDTWTPNVVLVITPSSKHSSHFKLHVIDRLNEDHLGMTSITKQELCELRTSKAFDNYSTIIGNKYVDLKSVAANTAIITNLIKSLNRECNHNSFQLVQTDSRNNLITCQKNVNLLVEQHSQYQNYPDIHTESNVRLLTLMERINGAYQPDENDLNKFFHLADKYKFKLYIRPELCWQPTAEPADEYENTLTRFNVECFMLFDNYVGTIAMNSDQLYEQLNQHSSLLPRIQVIEDVCEITPLPKMLIASLRKLSSWLGLEMLYDAFGEFIFDLYKQCT